MGTRGSLELLELPSSRDTIRNTGPECGLPFPVDGRHRDHIYRAGEPFISLTDICLLINLCIARLVRF
jgi:hypothetical protein